MTYTSHQCKVVVIIPTYNEASIIQDTVSQVFEAVREQVDFNIHVLIFDSASSDGTQDKVRMLQKQYPFLHVQSEEKKSGLGSAYLQAMRYALTTLSADVVFEFDADLSHQPKYILPMLKLIKTCDVVVGSRYINGGRIPRNWAFHRKLFSILGNYVARALLTPKYRDFTSGFRATRRQVLQRILPSNFLSNHYAYKLQLLWLLHKSNAKIEEYPIEFVDREKGESKFPKNNIRDSLRVVFWLRFEESKRYFKMCLVGLIGMFIQFSMYNLLRSSFSPFQATKIAVTTAIVINFILNNHFTFKNYTKIPWLLKINRLAGFVLYSVLMIYVQSYWLQLGINYLGTGIIRENFILITGIGLGSIVNYLIYSNHIWPEYRTRASQSH